jgi:hypothetical protein
MGTREMMFEFQRAYVNVGSAGSPLLTVDGKFVGMVVKVTSTLRRPLII